ncbi:glycine zipper 2TM domain-containing protein [Sphingomonas elodea]|uniref:glycine zipper 2TM domain-containing protein n=1 Tax=Sphingomonas elodea TaxID=179878 RepID=UPI0002630687|nr:glycine zipper 2TM domain-containing protein [Sphingomonas elodea]
MKKVLIGATLAATLMTGSIAATPAAAQDWGYRDGYGHYDRDYRGDYREYRDYRGDRPRYAYRDRYYRQRCSDGTTGTILGAIAGGLLGGEIGRGSSYRRSGTGTIIGAGAGALAGRAIDGGDCRGRR